MQEEQICLGCMQEKSDPGPCPKCGFDADGYRKLPIISEGIYLPLGTRLFDSQYITGKILGHGGFGITYLALDDHAKKRVAIKEYLPRNLAHRSPEGSRVVPYSAVDRTSFQKGLEQFLDEARILVGLKNHPGVVRVQNYFYENGTGYIVMDYLEGRSLEDYLNMLGRPLQWAEALLFVNPVLATLKDIHAVGLIHRDISPDNIFVCDDGAIRLLDFGAARLANRDYNKSLTVVMKPGYAPLEQYSRKGRQGPFTDVYAVAATLYRLITGDTAPEASERVDGDPLPALLESVDAIPPEAKPVLLKALALGTEQRYASIEDFRRDLLSLKPAKETRPASVVQKPLAPSSSPGPSGGPSAERLGLPYSLLGNAPITEPGEDSQVAGKAAADPNLQGPVTMDGEEFNKAGAVRDDMYLEPDEEDRYDFLKEAGLAVMKAQPGDKNGKGGEGNGAQAEAAQQAPPPEAEPDFALPFNAKPGQSSVSGNQDREWEPTRGGDTWDMRSYSKSSQPEPAQSDGEPVTDSPSRPGAVPPYIASFRVEPIPEPWEREASSPEKRDEGFSAASGDNEDVGEDAPFAPSWAKRKPAGDSSSYQSQVYNPPGASSPVQEYTAGLENEEPPAPWGGSAAESYRPESASHDDLVPPGFEKIISARRPDYDTDDGSVNYTVYNKRKWPLVLIVILVIAFGLGGGWLFYVYNPEQVKSFLDFLVKLTSF